MSLERVIAQPSAVRTLRKAVQSERLANAYLFDGPPAVGKTLAAISLAQEALRSTLDVEKVMGSAHPDIRVFGPRDEGHGNIKVAFIRDEVLPFTRYAPFSSERAFVIFPDADVSFPSNHPESANAILKTLEEPKARVHFILTASRPDRLLPTIRSRCQRVRFNRLTEPAVARLLRDQGIEAGAAETAASLAGGQMTRALQLASQDQAEALVENALRIDRLTEGGGPGALCAIAETLAKQDNLDLVLETLGTFYRDVAAVGLDLPEHHLMLRTELARVRERSHTLSPGQAAERVDALQRTSHAFERNANRQLALEALLFTFRGFEAR